VKLVVHNHLTDLVDATNDEYKWLSYYVGYWEVGFYRDRMGRAKRGKPRRVSLLRDDRFPSGLIRLVAKAAKEEGHTVEFVDERRIPAGQPDPTADLSFLRDFQQPAVEVILKKKRGVIDAVTGSGKTVLAVGLAHAWPIRWLFLVGQKQLLNQTAAQYLKHTGRTANIIGDGRFEIHDNENFTVATKQTLAGRTEVPAVWDFVSKAEGVILDEAHSGAAETDQRILLATENAYCRVGLSGTPWDRSDRKSLLILGALGPTLYKITAPELIERGLLAPLRINMHAITQASERVTWTGVYHDLVVKSVARNKLLVEILKTAAKPCLCFVKEVSHGKELAKRATKAGLRTEFVWGSASTQQREAAFERLIRRDIDVVIGSPAFYQGIDVPALHSVVIGTGGKSVIETLQRIGRGMRPAPGKTECEVYDIMDEGNTWMEKHARERMKAYEKAGHPVTVSGSSPVNSP
jgi:superfamily II DNA or RNA helicase